MVVEYTDLVQDLQSRRALAGSAAGANVDADPDRAAESIRLGSATNINPSIINDNFDEFKSQYRSGLTNDIVRSNPSLSAYVASHPLASQVSNDDWANLDRYTKGTGATAELMRVLQAPEQILTHGIAEGWQGFKEGVASVPSALAQTQSMQGLASRVPATVGWYPFIATAKMFQGIGGAYYGAVHGAAKAASMALGDDEGTSENFGDQMAGFATFEVMHQGGRIPEVAHVANLLDDQRAQEFVKSYTEAATVANPWLANGLEPPRGLHPLIDQGKAQANAAWLDGLENDLSNAQQSLTKQRSAEMFAKIETRYGDSQLSINGKAALDLYGTRPPSTSDGLLGWVPGIEDKLIEAQESGGDIHIPVNTWLANVKPEIAAALHDDIRGWPGGITANEAKEPIDYSPTVDAPLAQTRAAANLEPMFSVGDRKLTLNSLKGQSIEDWAKNYNIDLTEFPEYTQHLYDRWSKAGDEYQILDNKNQVVGRINISQEGNQLYVNMIEGLGDNGPNSFGPSLIRDLQRQLHTLYPDTSEISGHRISGARIGKAAIRGEEANTSLIAKLSTENIDPGPIRQTLNNAYLRQFNHDTIADVRPLGEHESRMSHAINEEIYRIAGPGVGVIPAHEIIAEGVANVKGSYFRHYGLPTILYDLLGSDPKGVARHETIHYLRDVGFFTPQEWATLERASMAEDWIGRYRIDRRYPWASAELKLEESVAEGYRDWAEGKDSEAARALGETRTTRVFQKLHDLWNRLRERFNEIFNGPSWEGILQQIHDGRVAKREANSLNRFGQTAFSIGDNLTPGSTGLDLASFRRMQKAIQDRYDEDLAKAQAKAEAAQQRRQSKEWKTNLASMVDEVTPTIQQRPDIAADLFLGSGELGGRKLHQRYTIRADTLTPAQRAALPSHYISRDGLPVDGVAHMFGYPSGDAMVSRLASYNAAKEGRTPQEMLRHTISLEANRRMEDRYGKLSDNIMLEARDQALSETNLNLVAEEYQAAGIMAKKPTVDKAAIKDFAKDQFASRINGEIKSSRDLAEVGYNYRDAVRALAAGDHAEALIHLQRRYLNSLLAAESVKFERERAAFDKDAKSWAAPRQPKMDPEYVNYLHQLLGQIGKPVRRTADDLISDMTHRSPAQSLEAFIISKQDNAFRRISIPKELLDPAWHKPYASLTVGEFRAIHKGLKELAWNANDELKIVKSGESFDLSKIKSNIVDQIRKEPILAYDGIARRWLGPIPPRLAEGLRGYQAESVHIENIFNHIDRGDMWGVLNQFGIRDLIEDHLHEVAWRKEFSKYILDALDKAQDMDKSLDNPLFRSPKGIQSLIPFTRANLLVVMLNTGTDSNLVKMARGYNLEPSAVEAWVHQHATRADWDMVEDIWNIFAKATDREDEMYRSITGGMGTERIPGRTIHSLKFGDIQGQYYPLIFHPYYEGKSMKPLGGDVLDENRFFPSLPTSGHTKARTGYIAPLAFDLDMMPIKLGQILHNAAMRPALMNAAKLFNDHTIRSEISTRFSQHYADLLRPYLQDIAGSADPIHFASANQKRMSEWIEFIRRNEVMSLVGANIGTIEKHLLTGWLLSMQEVGPLNYLHAMKSLFGRDEATGDSNFKFVHDNSLEIQQRHQVSIENLTGATQELVPSGPLGSLRNKISELASLPIAMADFFSSYPSWLAMYQKTVADGGSRGDAIYAGNRAVRRAHGTTSITGQPGIVRAARRSAGGRFFKSFYTVFSNIMNRQLEMIWNAGDALDALGKADYAEAMTKGREATSQLFTRVLLVAAVDQLINPLASKPGDTFAKKASKAVVMELAQGWIGVRDLARFFIEGGDASAGLLKPTYQSTTALGHDLMETFKGHRQLLDRMHAQRTIEDASQLGGLLFGLPQQLGKTAAFGVGVAQGTEHPRGPYGWMVGASKGTLKGHSGTVKDYLKGNTQQ